MSEPMTRDEWDDDQTDRERKIRIEEQTLARDRKLQAEALREVAENLDDLIELLLAEDDAQYIGGSTSGLGPSEALAVVEAWLADCADRMERGEL